TSSDDFLDGFHGIAVRFQLFVSFRFIRVHRSNFFFETLNTLHKGTKLVSSNVDHAALAFLRWRLGDGLRPFPASIASNFSAGPRGFIPASQRDTVLWSTPIASPSCAWVSFKLARSARMSIWFSMTQLWKTHNYLSMSFS